MKEPAIALVEFTSIARGIKAFDEMMKKAPVRLLDAGTLCPGKYFVLIAGEVAPVEESFLAGVAEGGDSVVDRLFLPNAHEQLIPAIQATVALEKVGSIGVVETFSVASAIISADAAAKAAEITLMEIRLARGIGGKGYFTLTGELFSVEAAVEAAVSMLKETGLLLRKEIIPRPHADLVSKLV